MSGYVHTNIHFIGIGGISMSALALILHSRGFTVSGSDTTSSAQTDELKRHGIKVFLGHNSQNLPSEPARIVINGAIGDNNPELIKAKNRKLDIIGRHDLLAEVASTHKIVIAVAGTHGKSTTTAMVGKIFSAAGLNPTIHNGAVLNGDASSLTNGSNEYFITEACEFKKSFLSLKPTATIITNINPDHMDCYCGLSDLQQAFSTFAAQSKKIIINADCMNSSFIESQNKTSYGINTNVAIHATNIDEHKPGKYKFTLSTKDAKIDILLNVVGYHNIYNALASASIAIEYGIELDIIKSALEAFNGIKRRFEIIGKIKSCDIVSDYAHHPTEVATTIATANSLYKKYLIVFQPHTYTRTKFLFADFVETLKNANIVFYNTYSAREKSFKGGRSKDLADAIDKSHYSTKTALIRAVNKNVENYDAIIFTGAGDIDAVAREILN